MSTVSELGALAWRDYVVDGVSGSGINPPLKSEIQAFVAAVGAFLDGAPALFWDSGTEQLGLNTDTPAAGAKAHFVAGASTENVLLLNHNLTDPAYEPRSLSSVLTATFTSNNAHDQLAMFGTLFVNPGTHTQSASHNAGAAGGGYGFGAGTVTKVSGVFGNSGNQGAGTVTNAHDFYSRTPINSGGGTVTNYWGYFQEDATGTTGVSNLYGIRVAHPSLFGGSSAPTLGYQVEVRGALLTLHGASSLPPSSGTTLGNGLQQTWDDNSGAAMFAYGNGGSGFHLLVSDKGSLGTSYPLIFQKNGGLTEVGGILQPTTDNTQKLGDSSFRWSTVYAGTGAINTSGRAAKVGIHEASDQEKRAAARIRGMARIYQLADAVAEKGDAARLHVGYVAEDVRDALVAEKLDPARYAFFCIDPVVVTETYTEAVQRPKMEASERTYDQVEMVDGRPVLRTVTEPAMRPVGQNVPVVDEAGQPIMHTVGHDPATGKPIRGPRTHFVPEMEEVQEQRTRKVETGEQRLGLRYSELEAFLRCAD